MDTKGPKVELVSEEPLADPLRCEHPELRLERGSTYNYLTGWYLCLKCGERLIAR